ncbi:hypothetical protein ACFYNL_34510 [Streptomyces sp. NPDC007808]|uniref:hypothetical protein n=1 Tax=Streptomyces sp. NPDC007808 TaxID=3364779 RepID=UPI0036C89D34
MPTPLRIVYRPDRSRFEVLEPSHGRRQTTGVAQARAAAADGAITGRRRRAERNVRVGRAPPLTGVRALPSCFPPDPVEVPQHGPDVRAATLFVDLSLSARDGRRHPSDQ